MHDTPTRLGVVAIPVYGLLVFLSTLSHQPDPRTEHTTYACGGLVLLDDLDLPVGAPLDDGRVVRVHQV